MPIQPLAAPLISRIVAGEVIDSLAAVVRELAENSIDAGATRLSLSLWPEQGRLVLVDDGEGMEAADLILAATPHSTSKLSADLDQITTLGFRGEALHSLAQVAHLQIQSRTLVAPHGSVATYDEQGQCVQIQPTPIATGTRVEVSQLFAQWPSRQALLHNPRRELKRIQAVIQNLAIANPQITWHGQLNDQPWLSYWPGSLTDRLVQLIPNLEPNHLRQHTQPPLTLTLALPDRFHRPKADWQRIVINGRCVDCTPLQDTLRAALSRSVPRDRQPVWVAQLQLTGVDWNRHPAKQAVYVPHLEALQDQLQQLAQAALAQTSRQSFRRSQAIVQSTAAQYVTAAQPIVKPQADQPTCPPQTAAIVGYWQNTYILIDQGSDLLLVEQHVADERVRFTQLQAAWQLSPCEPPPLLANLSPAQRERLDAWGWQPEPFGDDLWTLRQVPTLLHDHPERDALLRELSHCDNLEAAQIAIACRTAIRNGQPLSPSQQSQLIQAWLGSPNPHTCPHGRPIYLSLRENSLARYFRRHWRSCQPDPLSPRLFTKVNPGLQSRGD